jgi:tetratricopeptide (TPR) repeat protein
MHNPHEAIAAPSTADAGTPTTADPAATTGSAVAAAPAASVTALAGRYLLGAELARGGMGIVYRATDTVLEREVALKVLQHQYAPDSGMVRRFAVEACIAGRLQHPGIPPVHDLGTLADGRPFLAMKLIQGATLDQLLADQARSANARGRFVAAFEQVCQALAYAHAHGVIHRDLKPSNVMVGAFGEVQVMDWGLAKVLGARPADPGVAPMATPATKTQTPVASPGSLTQTGAVMGTPAFMPPEQATGIEPVDQRADVFGLGAILAVILTGEPPFVASSAATAQMKAAEGQVEECFARLDDCGAAPEIVALCKRCLAPQAAQRPADAGEVARVVADLRIAADERARRAEGEKAAAEAAARERRKRRRLWLGAAAALVLATLAGLLAVLAVQHRANVELSAEQAKVESRFELAQKAIATFHSGVSEDVLLKNKEFAALRTRLLKQAATFYGDLEKLLEGQTDAKSRRLLASGYYQLGDLTEKIASRSEALTVHRRALAVRRELSAAPGADIETRLDVARSLQKVAGLLSNTGDPAGALATYEEQRELADALAAAPNPEAQALVARSNNGIGYMRWTMGKPAEASAAYATARDIQQKLVESNPGVVQYQRDLASTCYGLARVLMHTGKPTEALIVYRAARDLNQRLSEVEPDVIEHKQELSSSQHAIAVLLAQSGKLEEALTAFKTNRELQQELVHAYPAVTQFQSDLAYTQYNIGNLFGEWGKLDQALPEFEAARDIRKKLVELDPRVPEYQNDLAGSHKIIGYLLRLAKKRTEAQKEYEQARAIQQKLADAHPTVPEYHIALARIDRDVGELLQQMEKPEEALRSFERSRDISQKLADAHPTVTQYQLDLAWSHRAIGDLHADQVRWSEAMESYRRGLTIFQKLAEAEPSVTQHHSGVMTSLSRLGKAYRSLHRPADAVAAFRQAAAVLERLPNLTPAHRFNLACYRGLLADMAGDSSSGLTVDEGRAFADQAMDALRQAVAGGYRDVAQVRDSTDLAPLRPRSDFQQLMKELESQAANPGRSQSPAASTKK